MPIKFRIEFFFFSAFASLQNLLRLQRHLSHHTRMFSHYSEQAYQKKCYLIPHISQEEVTQILVSPKRGEAGPRVFQAG